jgi:uncharacterized protein YqeY
VSLEKKLEEDMKLALKEKDKLKLSVIRYTRSAIQRFKIDNLKKEISEGELENILLSEAKKRRDSIQMYREGGREDLVFKEEKELEILLTYLPKQLSREELIKLIKEKLLDLGASGKQDFGRVMKVIIPAFRNQANGNVIKEIVQEELSK